MKLNRIWSPNGYDRAVELFEKKFYDGSHFFRVVKGFLVQFGISYSEDKELKKFAKSTIKDDPPKGIKFKRGTVSYAGSGDNSRTSQLFISYGSAASLGREKWETPIGEVIEGMEHVESFYSYGDIAPFGPGPAQGKIYSGPSYIEDNFPKTDSFIRCRTERLNTVDDDDDKIVRKSDHKTDEESFAASFAKKQAAAVGKLRLNSPLKQIQDGSGDTLLLIAGIICFLLGLLLVVIRLLNNRKSKASKSS
eukprot:CAMPEP_0113635552 /NCGR_PEP_ID=MMETSP0017_2-20120614/18535_1 /TAXON_ID=2856 /ORGANISM="Cylindrotheca closterium" /LENGTH=249 /DNA_ID=CAMNT_0000546343 /DNA_START=112 /DNA_END=861 /DNA_ORIENTATION=- /assembly_acc=CAM_ASM_000147